MYNSITADFLPQNSNKKKRFNSPFKVNIDKKKQ